MLVPILIGVAALIVVLVIVVATRPSKFRIQRSITIAAPAATVFDQVNDFHAWTAWSPWEKIDPQLQRTYTGPNSGVGAMYAWVGNKNVGEGRMIIEKSTRPSEIIIKLEFLKPFKATNKTTFTFTPEANGTHINWAMDGQNGFISKAFCMLMNMDKMVGKDFEKGLAAIKQIAENREPAHA